MTRPKDFRNNKLNRRRLNALQRRHDHLKARVAADSRLTFDAQECAALRWAISVLNEILERQVTNETED